MSDTKFTLDLEALGQDRVEALTKALETLTANFDKLGRKQIDPLRQLLDGIPQLDALDKRVNALIAKVEKGFNTKVDFDITQASKNVDVLLSKGKQFIDLFAKDGKAKIDLDVSQANKNLDLLAAKGRQTVDFVTNGGKTRIDLDVSTANKNLDLLADKSKASFDLIALKGKTAVDVLTQLGRTKVDFDITKTAAGLDSFTGKVNSANTAAGKFVSSVQGFRNVPPVPPNVINSFSEFERNTTSSDVSLRRLASTALLVRSAIFALGIGKLASETLETIKAFDGLQASFKAVFGDNADKEFAFISAQAERLGLSVRILSAEYAKFSIATKSSGIATEELQRVFLAVAGAGAQLSLSQENINGALTALQQIASKGRLSLEELRQQLGDRLPGAIAIAAKGLGITEAKLFDLVSAGQITSKQFLTTFAPALEEAFGINQQTRVITLSAEIQRFKNSVEQLLNSAGNAGLRDELVKLFQELTKVITDPATIAGVKSFTQSLVGLFQFIRENISVITLLIKTLLGFAALNTAVGAITAYNAALAATAVTATGATATLTAFRAAALNPITIAVTTVGVGAIKLIANEFDKVLERKQALDIGLGENRTANAFILGLQKQIEKLSEFADTAILTAKELKSLTNEGLTSYANAATGNINLVQAQISQNNKLIEVYQKEQKQLEDLNSTKFDPVAEASIQSFKDAIVGLTNENKSANATLIQLKSALADTNAEGAARGLAVFTENLKTLPPAVAALVTAFADLTKEGKSTEEALAKIIPTTFGKDGSDRIKEVVQSLAILQEQGKITGSEVRAALTNSLKGLSPDQLAIFQNSVSNLFTNAQINAKAFATVVDATAIVALKNIGVEAGTASSKVSVAFADIVKNFIVLGTTAGVTGQQIGLALDKAVNSAKTREELLLLQQAFNNTGIEAAKLGATGVQALQTLEDKLRTTSTITDGPLAESFKRLGASATADLKNLGDQAQIDFQRIRDSGLANTEQLRVAYLGFAAQITKANSDIPPIQLKVLAPLFADFDTVVKAAQTAGDRASEAFSRALGSAKTVEQLNALKDALATAFNQGTLSAKEYETALINVQNKLFETSTAVTGQLGNALSIFGIQTKSQLEAVAARFKEQFDIIANSGQVTTQDLAKAFEKYAEAAIAANGGVADSFLQSQAAALGFESNLAKVEERLGIITERAKEATAQLNGFNVILDQLDTTQLESDLQNISLGKAFATRGARANIINELARRGKDAGRFRDLGADVQDLLTKEALQINQFTFNNADVSATSVRNNVIPALDRQNQRRA